MVVALTAEAAAGSRVVVVGPGEAFVSCMDRRLVGGLGDVGLHLVDRIVDCLGLPCEC